MQKLNASPGRILVTGGTGHLGRHVVWELLGQGRTVRVLARLPGSDPRVEWAQGDLGAGLGLREALDGVDTVIHAATFSPIAQRGHIKLADFFTTPKAVDVEGTARLLDESQRAGVAHFLHVSIVGLHPDSSLPYNRVKLASEQLVRESKLSWSMVHATPFFYLLARLLHSMRRMPLWIVPDAVMQPVDTTDVAAHIVRCIDGRERGILPDIGGPQAKSFAAFAHDYLQARHMRRLMLRVRLSESRAAKMGFACASGVEGRTAWRDWLSSHTDEPRSSVRIHPSRPEAFGA